MFLFYLFEEQDFLLGNRAQPMGESLLEKGDVTVGEETEGYCGTEGYCSSEGYSMQRMVPWKRLNYVWFMPFAVTVIFNVLLLFCSILMVLSSVLLILGLRQVSVLKRTLSTSITDGTSIPPEFAEQAASADTLDLLHAGRPAHRGLPPGALVPLPPR